MKLLHITEDLYYDRIEAFNTEYPDAQYMKEKQEIMDLLTYFFARKIKRQTEPGASATVHYQKASGARSVSDCSLNAKATLSVKIAHIIKQMFFAAGEQSLTLLAPFAC